MTFRDLPRCSTLVPACTGASLLTAAVRKELPQLLNFSVEKAASAKDTKAD